jgi:hypothetical protein
MRAPTRSFAALLAALIAAPAAGGDLTGVWKGKFSCTMESSQGRSKLTSRSVTSPDPGVSTLEITQPDGPGTSALQARIDDALFAGFVVPTGAAAAGAGAFVDCDPNNDPGGFGEIRSFRWKVAADTVSGSISWRGLFVNDDAEISTCKGKWRRVSREDPLVESCR